jgi:phosphatidylserine synthase
MYSISRLRKFFFDSFADVCTFTVAPYFDFNTTSAPRSTVLSSIDTSYIQASSVAGSVVK